MTTRSVVVCDDDQILAAIVKTVFSRKDFQVQTAADGAAALRLVKAMKPQLVLLDLDMPEKNGFEVLQDLRATYSDKLYKIVVSGHEDKDSHDRALALGADEVWMKPFNAAKLLSAVETLIKEGKV